MKLIAKLHQKLGLFLAVFLILLSLTGIILNHSDSLRLDQRYAPAWIASLYLPDEEVLGVTIGDTWYFSLGDGLFRNQTRIAVCSDLQGVLPFDEQIVVLCDAELLLLTEDGDLIERVDVSRGLPASAVAIGVVADGLYVATQSGQNIGEQTTYAFDLWDFVATQSDQALAKPNWTAVPRNLLFSGAISWQQFILDVHSGAVVGLSGKLFNDLLAIFIILMALSGVFLWRKSGQSDCRNKQ